MFVKFETLSAFPVMSSNGMIFGSVVGWDSGSGSAGESGILIVKIKKEKVNIFFIIKKDSSRVYSL